MSTMIESRIRGSLLLKDIPVFRRPAAEPRGIGDFAGAVREAMRAYVASLRGVPFCYQLGGLRAEVRGLRYGAEKRSPAEPTTIGEFRYVNDTDRPQCVAWKDGRSTVATSRVVMSRGLAAGGNAGLALPRIALGQGVEVQAQLGTSLPQNLGAEQRWAWEVALNVPAHSEIVAHAVLARETREAGFSAEVRIDGGEGSCAVIALFRGVRFESFSRTPGEWLAQTPADGFTPDGSGVTYRVAGTQRQVQATQLAVEVHEQPLPGAGEGAAARSYRMDNVHAWVGAAVPQDS